MKNIALLTLAATALAGAALAAPVSPDQALQRLSESRNSAVRRAVGSASGFSLVDLKTAEGVYLFINSNDRFVVAPADDLAPALLGYGSNLDADNIPPAMVWLLGEYSRQIEWLKANPSASEAAAPAAEHAAIEPLIMTHWNQGAPYNNLCPSVGSTRTVTGCVATAMAQVMNYHQWPQTHGTGSVSYEWNGTTLSYDFASASFDWANMLNDYSSDSPTQAQNAVAQLMYACGVSVEMDYNISANGGSGASSSACIGSLKNYFGYDVAGYYAYREYYTDADWDALIYGELEAGRPVLYDGQSSQGGHAFICDGYQGDGYYHINWGWGGLSDNYFLLSALDPDNQGIGGSDSGFNYMQGATIGLQRPVAGSKPTLAFCASAPLQYDAEKKAFYFGKDGQYYNAMFNYSGSTLNVEPGVKLVNAAGDVFYAPGSPSELEPGYGFIYIRPSFPSDLPAGTYTAYPAVRYADGGDWADVRIPADKSNVTVVRKGANGVITFDGSDPDAVTVPVKVTELEQGGEYWTIGQSAVMYVTFENATSESQTVRVKFRFTNTSSGNATEIGYWDITVNANSTQTLGLNCGVWNQPNGVYSVEAIDMNLETAISKPATFYVGKDIDVSVDAINDASAIVNVYSLQGVLVRGSVEASRATEGLPAGLYIISGRKVLVK